LSDEASERPSNKIHNLVASMQKENMSQTTQLMDLVKESSAAAKKHGHGEAGHGHDAGGGHGGVSAALGIWLGILIDGLPESLVIGILVNTASTGSLVTFVVGVFIANFPESMSSAGIMFEHGFRRPVILAMWASICLMTGIGAFAGAKIFSPGSTDNPVVEDIIGCIEGLCGGAMLTMIANTCLPEAFEQGGNVTGLSTLFGFLTAIAVSTVQF